MAQCENTARGEATPATSTLSTGNLPTSTFASTLLLFAKVTKVCSVVFVGRVIEYMMMTTSRHYLHTRA